ncbi:hypothetical protein BOTNAR_0045g00070 [Botryotinia narcissicola]|uniref:Uncharacterized protein n=1 Tax=Botryotinia narcissicola TaxID=278944 RepID=A0A4Z1JDH4_9HELO|nr:hypothetical protein BOTNAR_0045g00070 [Botryotinia narcissicola]
MLAPRTSLKHGRAPQLLVWPKLRELWRSVSDQNVSSSPDLEAPSTSVAMDHETPARSRMYDWYRGEKGNTTPGVAIGILNLIEEREGRK